MWLTNLYIFDAIFNWEKENESIIHLEYDVAYWYKNDCKSLLDLKRNTHYKMVYNKRNENLKNELIALHGKQDKIYAIGKYFHQMDFSVDDIKRSSVKVSVG